MFLESVCEAPTEAKFLELIGLRLFFVDSQFDIFLGDVKPPQLSIMFQ